VDLMMYALLEILVIWPFVLFVELGIAAFFIWTARDKPQRPNE
jgi:hypothetical protein